MVLLAALLAWFSLLTAVPAALDPKLAGTWSTKSRNVVTGPDFYDPIKDRFKEPENTGISYSFTDDGFFEEAYYRAISNPTTPSCPSGFMQFQHGKYSVESNGSLVLTPFAVDGRQLFSNPCKGKESTYYRFNQTEIFKVPYVFSCERQLALTVREILQRYEVQIDPFHNVKRLNLFQFDGTPMNPMFLIYDPPQMLPTQTLNPTTLASATGQPKAKRSFLNGEQQNNQHKKRLLVGSSRLANPDNWWWAGVVMTIAGGATFLYCEIPWKR
ncbi:predicted protein [Uncinocarpus reesii 1704]|uniref:Protein ROT1 n=1 Tax=Uncinocarpus reesii (strain UAMH 1704) TaxID=336963 RepID=C4JFU4_UNCRE|nr:uncharacterized protein UREG_02428 [Uncinocarpus reesii 1704]EEP77579.1 predicted protein [Uncinocarpus reesii 1704]